MDINSMKNKLIVIDKDEIKELGSKYFNRICADSIEGEQKEAFLKSIRNAQEHVLKNIEPKVICSYYNIDGECYPMVLEGNTFEGGIFNYFNQFKVNGILIYLLTIGDLKKTQDMKLLEQYYIDAWGSAYVEAAHDVLKAELIKIFNNKKDQHCYVSEPFGPGYFGINVRDTKKLYNLLNHEYLNLKISEAGMMNPEKSCSGFYMISNEDISLPEDNCAYCKAIGNCEYCRKKNV
ncbi:hypothetical protein [Anaerovorax odorimutans]|uniref:hypothetical protein n=1 Tax=Anaerovorax odorimutans TaxID=109327 RepID=UPI000489826A|nr:hypothetical protein [Anaerovorax odorimutans]